MLITLTMDEVTDKDEDELEEGLGDALSQFLVDLFDENETSIESTHHEGFDVARKS